jgi:anaerobic selenocysteine-containing dehydrogenase
MDFLRTPARLTMHRADAAARGLRRGSTAALTLQGATHEVEILTSTRIAQGCARIHAGTTATRPGHTGWYAASVTAAAPVAAGEGR